MQVRTGVVHKDIEAARSGWFECSCCPTNLTRLIPSVPGYVYAQKDDNLYVNLFINSNTELQVRNKPVRVVQLNNYPWDGALMFAIDPAKPTPFNLLVRIPGWARNEAIPSTLYSFENNSAAAVTIKVNGQPVEYTLQNGYAVISRTWKKNDKVEVNLPMEVRRVVASEKLAEDKDKIALQRGPLIYCAEWVDNNGKASNFIIPPNISFTTEFNPGLLNGVMVLKAEVPAVVIKDNVNITTERKPFVAIPYYSWANRGKGEMTIWFPEKVNDIELLTNK
jgi:DUF1680 family protein